MSAMDEKIANLRDKVERLGALLKEAEPGLFTWWEATGDLIDEIAEYRRRK